MTNSKYTTLAAVVLSLGLTACGDETKVSVTDHSGMALANATVSMDGKTVKADELGTVTISREQADKVSTLAIRAPGYINQSLEIEAVNSNEVVKRSISATLKAKNPVQKIDDISKKGSITAADGSIFVDFTPDSFVTADGKPATGAAEVSITPWYPTDENDMAAFLGDGYAQDLQGDMGQLLSYGAMTLQFTQNGKKLQLAEGKKAKISMPLSFNQDYDGTEMQVGDVIPMWHFDESKGFWVEEGEGQVVTNDDGDMMLTAEVSHFTTWNWDMKVSNPATVFVQCQLPDGTFVACSVSASVKYGGKYTKTRQINVPATGGDMINLDPNLDTMTFNASYVNEEGMTVYGKLTTDGLPNNSKAIIVLDKMPTHVSVKCESADGIAVDCNLKTKIVDSMGYTSTRNSEIDSTGAKITGINPNSQSMTFNGFYYDKKGNKFTGIKDTNGVPTDEVIVKLDTMVAAGVSVKCQLSNGTSVDCNLKTTIDNANGNTYTRYTPIESTGGIIKDIDLSTQGITFEGVYYDENGNKFLGTIVETGIPTDEVVVKLELASVNIPVKCQLNDSTVVACSVTTTIVNADGTTQTRYNLINSDGGFTGNVDAKAQSITFNAVYYDGMGNQIAGEFTTTSISANEVIIELDDFITYAVPVKCQFNDSTAVACDITTTIVNADGTIQTKYNWINSEGGFIGNVDAKAQSITFNAVYYDGTGNQIAGEFTTTSISADEVVIELPAIPVKCQLADGTAVECSVVATTLDGNGDTHSKNMTISETGGFLGVTGLDVQSITFAGTYFDVANNLILSKEVTVTGIPTDEVVLVLDESTPIEDPILSDVKFAKDLSDEYAGYGDVFSYADYMSLSYKNPGEQTVELTANQYKIDWSPGTNTGFRAYLDMDNIPDDTIDPEAVYTLIYHVSVWDGEISYKVTKTITLTPHSEVTELEEYPMIF